MSRPVRAATAPTARCPPRKRQRQEFNTQYQEQKPLQQRERPHWFLLTHLSLLRALHRDDDDATHEIATGDWCAHPSWEEVKCFINAQAIIVDNNKQAKRATDVLRALGGSTPLAAVKPRAGPAVAQHLGRSRADQAGALYATTPACRSAEAKADPSSRPSGDHAPLRVHIATDRESSPHGLLNPRAVVCSVLRRAVSERRVEHGSVCAGLAGLKRGVDETVDQLGTSWEALARSCQDRTTRWGFGRGGAMAAIHAVNIVEREQRKLALWKHLQSSLSACQ